MAVRDLPKKEGMALGVLTFDHQSLNPEHSLKMSSPPQEILNAQLLASFTGGRGIFDLSIMTIIVSVLKEPRAFGTLSAMMTVSKAT